MVHKRRYLVIGYGGSRLLPLKEYSIVGEESVAAKVRSLRSLPEIRGIEVEPATARNVLREMSFPLGGLEAEQAVWKDIPKVKEVIVLDTGRFGLPKYKRVFKNGA